MCIGCKFIANPTAELNVPSDCDYLYGVSESIDIYAGNILQKMILYENVEISFDMKTLQNWTCPRLSQYVHH